jgi:hypothetical protein
VIARRLGAAGALATLAALGACKDEGPAAPGAGDPLDVARLLAEMSPASAAAGVPLAGFAAVVGPQSGSGCEYQASSRSFVCAPATVSGLTVSVTYTLLDAAGNPQSRPDRATTAAVRGVTTVSGTTAVPGGSVTISQRQESTLTGLLGASHTLNGTSKATLQLVPAVTGAAVTGAPVTATIDQTIANLVIPATSAGSGAASWPTSGTITSDVASTVGGAATTTRIQIAFDGTSTASVTITSGGGVQRCRLNLATPSAPVCGG